MRTSAWLPGRRAHAMLRQRTPGADEMGRTIVAVLVGVISAWAVIMLFEFAGAAVYPPPRGGDLSDPDQLRAYIASAPAAAMSFVLAGWAAGAFLGGWVAAKLSHRHRLGAALAVG